MFCSVIWFVKDFEEQLIVKISLTGRKKSCDVDIPVKKLVKELCNQFWVLRNLNCTLSELIGDYRHHLEKGSPTLF